MSHGKGLKKLTVLRETYAAAVELADIQTQIWRMVTPGTTTVSSPDYAAETAIKEALIKARKDLAEYQKTASIWGPCKPIANSGRATA